MDFKFGITWLFDKLGYMPKIDMEIGKVNLKLQDTWPFPADAVQVKAEPKTKPKVAKKPAVKRASTKKPKTK